MVHHFVRKYSKYAIHSLVKDLKFHLPIRWMPGLNKCLVQLMMLRMYWNRQGNLWINSWTILINPLMKKMLDRNKFQLYTYTKCSWPRKMLCIVIWICWNCRIMFSLVIFGRHLMNKKISWVNFNNKEQSRFSYTKIIISLDLRMSRPMSVLKYFNWLWTHMEYPNIKKPTLQQSVSSHSPSSSEWCLVIWVMVP